MNTTKIAVPSQLPGGLTGKRADHFGHCDMFTLVEVAEGVITKVETIDNVAHGAGGCMMPVDLLREKNIDSLVVGGMGGRPLQLFSEAGIAVFFIDGQLGDDVQTAIDEMMGQRLPLMGTQNVCQGGCHE